MDPGSGDHTASYRQTASLLFFGLLLFLLIPLSAQEVRISADNTPLSQVILDMADTYGLQVSFDDGSLSRIRVSADTTLPDPEAALSYLLKGQDLAVQQVGAVYTIYPLKQNSRKKADTTYLYSGIVRDELSLEALPFTHVISGGRAVISDNKGQFSFSSRDSLLEIRFSYLGYYREDSLVRASSDLEIRMRAALVDLQEVRIKGSAIVRSGQAGEEVGLQRLNHQVASRLPGNGDNSVFNFLRLQPGILAAGERSDEINIWGSYDGHNRIQFDGFTIFGLKNYNDNLSFVNPYMAKDIRIFKGAYGPEFENRVGGIVDIAGVDGNRERPAINVNVNNMTINGMASVPTGRRSSLTLAYRNTYYNLTNAEDLQLLFRGSNVKRADITVYPDYNFRDFNLKFAAESRRGDPFHISLYQGRDAFTYTVEQERQNAYVYQESLEWNRQRGGSLFYGKNWNSGHSSHLTLSYSGLDKEHYEKQSLEPKNPDHRAFAWSREVLFTNQVTEVSLKNQNHFSIGGPHSLDLGWNYNYEESAFTEDSLGLILKQHQLGVHRLGGFVKGRYQPFTWLRIDPGLRLDLPLHLDRAYLYPSLRISADLDENITLNLAAGRYGQYMSQTSVVDAMGNYRYIWTVNDAETYPVLRSDHLAGGLSYENEGLSINIEGFFKTTSGLSRHIYLWRWDLDSIYHGDARSSGLDILIKQYFARHEAWLAYTYSTTLEYFDYMQDERYRYAPQDQRHELKGVILLNFDPVFFSANYVYGSGFRFPTRPQNTSETERYPYHRLDVALIYRYRIRDYSFEIGASVMNVLNHENIKYSSVIQLPDAQSSTLSIHAEAVPFTPAIYLNMKF